MNTLTTLMKLSISIFLAIISLTVSLSAGDLIAWKYKTNGRIIGSAAGDSSHIYFGSDDGTIHALEYETGEPYWTFQTGGSIASKPKIIDGILYILSGDGIFYAINTINGTPVWKFVSGGERRLIRNPGTQNEFEDLWDYYLSDAVVYNDMIYFGSGDSHIYALHRRSGDLAWKHKTGDVVHAAPTIHEGVLYVGGFDGYFYALDAGNGSVIWKFNTVGSRYFPAGAIQKGASVDGHTVFFGSRDGNIYALDAGNGTGQWNYKDPGGSWIIATPTIYNGNIYFGSSDSFSFYSLNAYNGSVNWKIPLPMRVFGSAVVFDQRLYFGALNGILYGVEINSGKITWQFHTDGNKNNYSSVYNDDNSFREDFTLYGSTLEEVIQTEETIQSLGSIFATPVIHNGTLFFGSADSTFYAVKLRVQ